MNVVSNKSLSVSQLILNLVTDHLMTQRERSYTTADGGCLYRGPGGTKCAIGSLMSDLAMGECNVVEGMVPEVGRRRGVTDAVEMTLGRSLADLDIGLLGSLQAVHDSRPYQDMPSAYGEGGGAELAQALLRTATDYGLEVPPYFFPVGA